MRYFIGKPARLATRIIPLTALVFALFALTACGGGGGSSVSPGPGVAPGAQLPQDGLPQEAPQFGASAETYDPSVNPAQGTGYNAIGYRMTAADIETATPTVTVVGGGNFNDTVALVGMDGNAITPTSSTVSEVANSALGPYEYIRLGVWAEGAIPTTGTAGATFPTGAFFHALRGASSIVSASDLNTGITIPAVPDPNQDPDHTNSPTVTIGVANNFFWEGTYTKYVDDGRPNYRNADADGNPQGTVGVSLIRGQAEARLMWNGNGDGRHLLRVKIAQPSGPAGLTSIFSRAYGNIAHDDWQVAQDIHITALITGGTTEGSTESSGFAPFELTPTVQIEQIEPLPGADFSLAGKSAGQISAHRARYPWIWDGCARHCFYPGVFAPSDANIIGAFFGGTGANQHAAELGGIFRFTIRTGQGDIRTIGAFGGKRTRDATAQLNP